MKKNKTMEIDEQLPLEKSSLHIINNRQTNHFMFSCLWFRLLLIATTVKSILGLIILFILLIFSIIVLIIGSQFYHSKYCPIEPRISFFLIIAGSISIEWIIFSMILSTITIILNNIRSYKLIGFIIIIGLVITLTNFILVIWVIFGSVWTLKGLDRVQHTKPYLNTYCQQTLYICALVYLILTYILFILQCWYRFCIVIFCSIQEEQTD